jgi:pyruvate-formate lyase-activating enzyme
MTEIIPRSFAFHLTYKCPLSCAHCCFSCGPTRKEILPIEIIEDTIFALSSENYKLIAFTGGEPFLFGKNLNHLVQICHNKGFVTRVVTSAYWAQNAIEATQRLQVLKDNGIDELSISWDDFHESQESEKMSFKKIKNAFNAAKRLNIVVAINIVQGKNAKWNVKRVRAELGVAANSKEIIVESPLNHTGRASANSETEGRRSERLLGPCPYVISGPTLSARGDLLACCGVIPHTDRLVIKKGFSADNLGDCMRMAMDSKILNWLYLRGPYAIMKWMSLRYHIDLPNENDIGGNCEACSILFKTKGYLERLDSALIEKGTELDSEKELLSILGILKSPSDLQRLWINGANFLDNSEIKER